MRRLVLLAMLVCAHGWCFQQDRDVYAVYSAIMSHPQTSHGADK